MLTDTGSSAGPPKSFDRSRCRGELPKADLVALAREVRDHRPDHDDYMMSVDALLAAILGKDE